jgi:hypothetical protein
MLAEDAPEASRIRRRLKKGRGLGLPVYLAGMGLWAFLLYGFVSLPALVILTLIGPLLARGGLRLVIGSAPHMLGGPQYIASFLGGLLVLAGAGLTLAPGWPDHLLAQTATGWSVLEDRADRLETAIDNGHPRLAGRLAVRGLGDPAPLDNLGTPLIHHVGYARPPDAALLADLLESGLDPDARDRDGRTLLMATRDPALTRVLLAAGADPNARQRGGYTVLMSSTDKEPEVIQLLLEGGADVHAVDEAGRPVSDFFPSGLPARELLEARAGRPLPEPGQHDPAAGGRTDWLAAPQDPQAGPGPSAILLDHRPLRYGEVAVLDIRLSNARDEDRLLDVEATLNGAALFVDASHGGAVLSPTQAGLQQTIRWPFLNFPAHRQGRLQLRIVARSDPGAGDLAVDVRARDYPGVKEDVLQVYERLAPAAAATASGGAGWLGGLLIPGALALFLLVGWRRGARVTTGRTVAALAALACGGIALVLLWSMVQPFVLFEQARCTVLDRRVLLRTTTSSTSAGATGSSASRGRTRSST